MFAQDHSHEFIPKYFEYILYKVFWGLVILKLEHRVGQSVTPDGIVLVYLTNRTCCLYLKSVKREEHACD